MSIICDATRCSYNDGNGTCKLTNITLSEIGYAEFVCQDADYEEEDD